MYVMLQIQLIAMAKSLENNACYDLEWKTHLQDLPCRNS